MSGYNGWTNRATWCAALWLDNDEDTRKAAERVAYWYSDVQGDIADEIGAEWWELLTDGAREDIGAFDDVNWAEVARDSFDIPAGEYDAAATVAALMGDDVQEWQV